MCKLFIDADPALWHSATHSLRIDGMVTSVRMENYFWQLLEEIAQRDGMNTAQMITRLYHESIDAGHDLGNFTSFLRVCALRYQALQLSGDIPLSVTIPIGELDAEQILARESALSDSTLRETTLRETTLHQGVPYKKHVH
ncbi:ribbon-helix-helix domain-containing protein [Vreelandella venusta]|uniref:ribbon-helix-helix domain-containing protein n=1 Tax=Vreelandella venusta TaxID=44935 RepID=UPI00384EBD12